MSAFTQAQLDELEVLIAERADAEVRAFMTSRLVTPHNAPGLFAFDPATPNIDQTRKASIDSTRDNLNDLNSRVTTINGNYLPLTGGALTGPLDVGSGTMSTSYIHINSLPGTAAQTRYGKGGSIRWVFETSSAAESGANAGSDFQLKRYSDAGALIGSVLSIQRASATWFITGALQVMNATTPVAFDMFMGDQSGGSRKLSYFNNYYLFAVAPLQASGYHLSNETAVAVNAGAINVDLAASAAFFLTVTIASAITFTNITGIGHRQLRVLFSAAVQLTFPNVTGWLGDAGPPTFTNGQTYFINLFSTGTAIYAQAVKVGA